MIIDINMLEDGEVRFARYAGAKQAAEALMEESPRKEPVQVRRINSFVTIGVSDSATQEQVLGVLENAIAKIKEIRF